MELYYRLPDHKPATAMILRGMSDIPWGYMLANVEATAEARRKSLILKHTGQEANRRVMGGIPRIVTKDSTEVPELADLYSRGALPAFFQFHEVGHRRGYLSLQDALRIASNFIQYGYDGWLRLYEGNPEEDLLDRACCSFVFNRWEGGVVSPKDESGPQPARVRLSWKTREQEAALILPSKQIFDRNLKEYVPEAFTAEA